MSRFDYDQEGHSIVLADGSELLVHDGRTEAPRWRTDVGARVVGVASNAISIASLDERGVLTIWSHETATEVRSSELGVAATAIVADYEGRSGAVHAGGVVTMLGGARRDHAVENTTAAAFSSADELLVGTSTGALVLFDAEGAPAGSANVPGPVHDITWNAGGFWLVANGGCVHRLDGLEVSHVTNAPEGEAVRGVACSSGGETIALHVGDKLAVAMSYPSRETVGNATYVDRTICGVAFGPSGWLGVGLDGGDANKFDLTTGATHRTDTHPGRQHNRWMLISGFGSPKKAPAPAPASGPAPVGPPLSPPPERGSMLPVVIAVVSVVLFLIMLALAVAFD